MWHGIIKSNLFCCVLQVYLHVIFTFQEAVVVKLRLKNTALKVQKRKLLLQLRQVCARVKMFD